MVGDTVTVSHSQGRHAAPRIDHRELLDGCVLRGYKMYTTAMDGQSETSLGHSQRSSQQQHDAGWDAQRSRMSGTGARRRGHRVQLQVCRAEPHRIGWTDASCLELAAWTIIVSMTMCRNKRVTVKFTSCLSLHFINLPFIHCKVSKRVYFIFGFNVLAREVVTM